MSDQTNTSVTEGYISGIGLMRRQCMFDVLAMILEQEKKVKILQFLLAKQLPGG